MAKASAAAVTRKKATDSPSTAMHPPYFEMISQAITALKERSGSSQPAIAKFIGDKYAGGLPPNFKKILSVQLKKFVGSERLVKIKNSYKLSSTERLSLAFQQESQKAEKANPSSAKRASTPKEKAGKTMQLQEKKQKMKRLSQVKTPEALKKATKEVKSSGKTKTMSQVKTPDGLQNKKKKHNLTSPNKRKLENSSPKPQKKKKSRK